MLNPAVCSFTEASNCTTRQAFPGTERLSKYMSMFELRGSLSELKAHSQKQGGKGGVSDHPYARMQAGGRNPSACIPASAFPTDGIVARAEFGVGEAHSG